MHTNLNFAYSRDRADCRPADATQNRRITLAELHRIITGCDYPASYLELPNLAQRYYRDGDKQAGVLLKSLKSELPYFLASGFCPKHHNNESLEYNGVLQIDIDLKTPDGDQQAVDVLATVHALRPDGVLLATLSPSTFGVKILLATNNTDKNKHSESLRAGVEYLANLLNIADDNFDTLPASQTVYVPYERQPGQTYLNDQAGVLQIAFKQQKHATTAAIEYDRETVLEAAQYLITNQISVAECYDDYLPITAACKNAFGDDGLQIAFDLLNNSAAFRSSDFSKRIKAKFKGLKPRLNGRQATGATIVWLANKNGFTGNVARNTTTLEAHDGEYLTEVLDRHNYPLQDVCGKYIESPTGSGKTTLVAEFARRYPDRRVVLVLPQLATIRQFCAKYPDAARFTGGKNNRQISGDERLLVTTVNSFPALATRIPDIRQYDVFLDEAHGLTADTSPGYKLPDFQKFLAVAKLARSLTQMSGTPLPNYDPALLDIEILKIRQRARINKTAYWIECDNILAATQAAIRRSFGEGRLPFLLLNDKKMKLAEVETMLADVNLAILNADKKDDQTFIHITETGKIPADRQAIVSTTVLREGTSIYDQRTFDFIVVGSHHSSTIQQITARARTAGAVNVYLLKSKSRKKADHGNFNAWRLAKWHEARAQKLCNEYNTRPAYFEATALYCERHLRGYIQTDPVHISGDGKMVVDYLHLNNIVHRAETDAEYQDDRLQAKHLRRYGFEIDGERIADYTGSEVLSRSVSIDYTPSEKIAIKQAKAEKRTQLSKAYNDALDTLQDTIAPATIIRQAEQSGKVPAAYERVKRLVETYGVTYPAAISALRDAESEKKYRTLVARIAAHRLRSNSEYMRGDRLLAIQMLALFDRLQIGTKYTAEQLRGVLVNVLAMDTSINLQKWQPEPEDTDAVVKVNRRGINILRVFFDIEKTGRAGSNAVLCPRKSVFSLNKIQIFGDTETTFFADATSRQATGSDPILETYEHDADIFKYYDPTAEVPF